ncbi:MAG: hypothetical protein ACRENE_35550 [Polyangiaceae bacterium]
MYAVVRRNVYDRTKLAQGAPRLAELDALHRNQPGFLGGISIDAGDGATVLVNLWESEAHAVAGLQILGPHVERLVEPLFAKPSQLLGAGPAVTRDLAPNRTK